MNLILWNYAILMKDCLYENFLPSPLECTKTIVWLWYHNYIMSTFMLGFILWKSEYKLKCEFLVTVQRDCKKVYWPSLFSVIQKYTTVPLCRKVLDNHSLLWWHNKSFPQNSRYMGTKLSDLKFVFSILHCN